MPTIAQCVARTERRIALEAQAKAKVAADTKGTK